MDFPLLARAKPASRCAGATSQSQGLATRGGGTAMPVRAPRACLSSSTMDDMRTRGCSMIGASARVLGRGGERCSRGGRSEAVGYRTEGMERSFALEGRSWSFGGLCRARGCRSLLVSYTRAMVGIAIPQYHHHHFRLGRCINSSVNSFYHASLSFSLVILDLYPLDNFNVALLVIAFSTSRPCA